MRKQIKKKGMPNLDKIFADQARENRRKFLAPYEARVNEIIKTNRQKVDDIEMKAARRSIRSLTPQEVTLKDEVEQKTKREIAKIIIDLIKREPSHLAEEWILWMVIDWLRNPDYRDFLEAAFIEETGRNRQTPQQQRRFLQDYFFMEAINKIRHEQGVSIRKACDILADRQAEDATKNFIYPTWDAERQNQDLGELMRKKYHQAKDNRYLKVMRDRAADWKQMPYPYWGRDIVP
jgi:hypothetical protein